MGSVENSRECGQPEWYHLSLIRIILLKNVNNDGDV